jgi:HEAT repeat protein
MQKLVEREALPRSGLLVTAPALAVQFFLIPMAVVAVVVVLYAGFRLMLADTRTPEDLLNDIRTGGRERRWPAAYELSRLMADPKLQAAEPTLGPALVRAFEEARADDPRVRQYLALAIGRLQTPPPEAVPALIRALDDGASEVRISVMWALAALGAVAAVPHLERICQADDPGLRKMAVYALGALPGDAQLGTLRAALEDPVADVQWNAAVALARHGDPSGVAVLKRMLDRDYVERTVARAADVRAEVSPTDEVLLSSLQALGALRERSALDLIAAVSRTDQSLRVRQAALEALRRIERGSSP